MFSFRYFIFSLQRETNTLTNILLCSNNTSRVKTISRCFRVKEIGCRIR